MRSALATFGLRSPFGRRRGRFTPAALFALAEPGVWFDPSPLTCFTDTARTTPATVGQAVAGMTDLSGRGNHATQATLASRPTLARVPANGRRNLLTRTEELDNAFWNKSGTTTVTSVGDGAWRINNFDAAEGDRLLSGAVTVGASATVNGAIEVRGEGSDIGRVIRLVVKRTAGGGFTGVVVTTTLTGDWQRINGSFTLGADNTAFQIALATNLADGTLPAAPLVRFPQGELGSTATAYQKVTSTFDVTEPGQADNWHLSFDGIDDSMVTPTITPGVDKVQVFAGVRKLSDATSLPVIYGHGTALNGANAGEFALFARAGTFIPTYTLRSIGTVSSEAGVATGYPAPITNVLTGIGDISGDVARLRIDGAQVAETLTDQGTGNFLAYASAIGSRAGTSLRFTGHIYSLIARFGPNLPTATIEKVEAYIAGETAGVSIP